MTTRGPGAFFHDHPGLYGLCLAGALGAAGYAAAHARKSDPGRASAWWALAGLTTAQAAGMAAARRRAVVVWRHGPVTFARPATALGRPATAIEVTAVTARIDDSSADTAPQAVTERLDTIVGRLAARRGVRHVVLRVERGDGSLRWAGAAGEARPAEPMQPDTAFHYASVAKLYTATVVLQLWERGSIDLDAPISAYLPPDLATGLHRHGDVDNTGAVTVRHLLAHTSGLPDYFLAAPPGETSYADRVSETDFAYTIADVVARVRQLPAHFPPQDPAEGRQRARYSDTNFQLLGAIIEAVTGRAFHEVVEAEVLEPLGLDDTWVAGHPRRDAPVTPAALWAGDVVLDVPLAMASLGPDGGLVGTAADAIAFLRALLAGEPFARPDTIQHMQARWNRFGLPRDRSSMMAPGWPIEYGLGILRFRAPRLLAPAGQRSTLVGHTGASGSWLFWCPEHDVYLAGTIDQTTAAAVPYRVGPRVVRAVSR